MKLEHLHEYQSRDQLDLIIDWIAKNILEKVRQDARVTQEVKGIAADEAMIYAESKKRLAVIRDKIETELYHLIHS